MNTTSLSQGPSPFIIILAIFVGLTILIGLYWLISYNGFITRRNRAKNAFSLIDIQLKKRWDLIPQLVATAKGYAKHEKELFEALTEARSKAQAAPTNYERFKNEETISIATPTLFALAESYPELKADQHFELLQRNLTEIEAQISAARRTYNASVTSYNTSLQTAPSNIIASIHNFKEMDLFSIRTADRENPTI